MGAGVTDTAPSGGRESRKPKGDDVQREPSDRPSTPAELRQERPSKRQERLAREREEAEKDGKPAGGHNAGAVKAAAGIGGEGDAKYS